MLFKFMAYSYYEPTARRKFTHALNNIINVLMIETKKNHSKIICLIKYETQSEFKQFILYLMCSMFKINFVPRETVIII